MHGRAVLKESRDGAIADFGTGRGGPTNSTLKMTPRSRAVPSAFASSIPTSIACDRTPRRVSSESRQVVVRKRSDQRRHFRGLGPFALSPLLAFENIRGLHDAAQPTDGGQDVFSQDVCRCPGVKRTLAGRNRTDNFFLSVVERERFTSSALVVSPSPCPGEVGQIEKYQRRI